MRPVSQGVRRAVEELHAAVREGARGGPAARLRGLVEGIGTSGEWMVIPHLVSLALDRSDEELADCAADAVLGLFDRVPLRGVHPLDRALREQSVWKLAAWYQLQPGELARISRRAHAPMLVQLLMCHPDGRVREAAIRMANLRPDRGRELRFLLVRLNDWVPEVRRAASEALRARLTASSADQLWRRCRCSTTRRAGVASRSERSSTRSTPFSSSRARPTRSCARSSIPTGASAAAPSGAGSGLAMSPGRTS